MKHMIAQVMAKIRAEMKVEREGMKAKMKAKEENLEDKWMPTKQGQMSRQTIQENMMTKLHSRLGELKATDLEVTREEVKAIVE